MSPEEGEEPGGSCSRQVFPGGAWLDVGWAQPLGLAPRTELPMGVRAHRSARARIHVPCWLLGESCVPVFMALLWKTTLPHKNRNPGMAGDRRQVPRPGQCQDCPSWPAGAAGCGERPAPLSFMNRGGSFLVEPCSSNWKGAGNPSVWRALEPLFERSVIFQSNSLPKPPFIKYSWDPFSPGTPSPRLSPKNQSGSSACSNASAFSGAWGCHLLPPPPSVPVPSPGSGDGSGCAGSGSTGRSGKEWDGRWGDAAAAGGGSQAVGQEQPPHTRT